MGVLLISIVGLTRQGSFTRVGGGRTAAGTQWMNAVGDDEKGSVQSSGDSYRHWDRRHGEEKEKPPVRSALLDMSVVGLDKWRRIFICWCEHDQIEWIVEKRFRVEKVGLSHFQNGSALNGSWGVRASTSIHFHTKPINQFLRLIFVQNHV